MDEAEAQVGAEQMTESGSLFSALDLVFLSLIIGALGWYLFSKHKKTTTFANGRSYSIQ